MRCLAAPAPPYREYQTPPTDPALRLHEPISGCAVPVTKAPEVTKALEEPAEHLRSRAASSPPFVATVRKGSATRHPYRQPGPALLCPLHRISPPSSPRDSSGPFPCSTALMSLAPTQSPRSQTFGLGTICLNSTLPYTTHHPPLCPSPLGGS